MSPVVPPFCGYDGRHVRVREDDTGVRLPCPPEQDPSSSLDRAANEGEAGVVLGEALALCSDRAVDRALPWGQFFRHAVKCAVLNEEDKRKEQQS